MNNLQSDVVQLILRTLTDPKGAAEDILAYEFSRPVLWNMLLLVVILSVLLTYGVVMISGQDSALFALVGSPLVLTLIMFSQLALLVIAIFWTGKAMGGTGGLDDFAALVGWLQTMWLIAQVVQIVILTVSPTTAALFGTISIVFGLWVISNFIAVAHGFSSWVKGAGVLVLASLGVIAGLSFMLSIIGFSTLGLSLDV